MSKVLCRFCDITYRDNTIRCPTCFGKTELVWCPSDEDVESVVGIGDINSSGYCTLLHPDGIGDINSTERGTGARYNTGKPDYSLIPLSSMADAARVLEYGAAKYNKHNWMKGMPHSVPYACMMRHLAAWQAGEDMDDESGLPHLAHAMCNLVMLIEFQTTYPEGDDRYAKGN